MRARDLTGPLWPTLAGVLAILLTLAPIGLDPSIWFGPNLLLIALAFWAARRPETVLPVLVFALGLTHELLRAGPIGAETFGLLIAIEILRTLSARAPARTFVEEWVRLVFVAVLLELIVRALFALTLAEPPPLWATVQRLAGTAAFYPIAVFLLHRLTGEKRRAVAEF